jgi:hypothetical protein
MPTIAFATSRDYPTLTESDRQVQAELLRLGVESRPAIWDDPAQQWNSYDLVVIRSCWDYHKQPEIFRAWLARLAREGVALWNPPELVQWNMDKRYLRDLAGRGVSVVPTAWLERGDAVTLGDVLTARGWDEVVVKPAISATAYRTWRVTRNDAAAHEGEFRAQLDEMDLLVQPFLAEITTAGEWSLIYFAGEFSHALRKLPQAGDFRVQEDHGGVTMPATPDAALLRQSRLPLAALSQPYLYARVDGVVVNGAFQLMELELIEPSLYTSLVPGASARFAAAIMRKLG